MKQAAKIFIIIGMIVGAIAIIPLVVGIIALKKLKTAQTKNDLTGIGVVTLIFCSLIGGILMLCITDEELAKDAAPVAAPAAAPAAASTDNGEQN